MIQWGFNGEEEDVGLIVLDFMIRFEVDIEGVSGNDEAYDVWVSINVGIWVVENGGIVMAMGGFEREYSVW
ncbi:hypothetical protein V6N12_021722 [Hibiscus sabdariffa]|uniref:Uncharacterized protein n=1 Tax=Hibiscus sabdariffa TaxID=183260 RepID=A0ABR2FSJ8_9ROSI